MTYNGDKSIFEKIKLISSSFSSSEISENHNFKNKFFCFMFLIKNDEKKLGMKTLGSVEIPFLYLYKKDKHLENSEPYNLIDFSNDDYSLIGKVKVINLNKFVRQFLLFLYKNLNYKFQICLQKLFIF